MMDGKPFIFNMPERENSGYKCSRCGGDLAGTPGFGSVCKECLAKGEEKKNDKTTAMTVAEFKSKFPNQWRQWADYLVYANDTDPVLVETGEDDYKSVVYSVLWKGNTTVRKNAQDLVKCDFCGHEVAPANAVDRRGKIMCNNCAYDRGLEEISRKNAAEKGKSSDKECKWCQGDESGKTYEYRVNGEEMVLHDKCAQKMQSYMSKNNGFSDAYRPIEEKVAAGKAMFGSKKNEKATCPVCGKVVETSGSIKERIVGHLFVEHNWSTEKAERYAGELYNQRKNGDSENIQRRSRELFSMDRQALKALAEKLGIKEKSALEDRVLEAEFGKNYYDKVKKNASGEPPGCPFCHSHEYEDYGATQRKCGDCGRISDTKVWDD